MTLVHGKNGRASRWKTEWVYDARGRMRTRTEFSVNAITGWVLPSETRYLYDGRRVIQELSTVILA